MKVPPVHSTSWEHSTSCNFNLNFVDISKNCRGESRTATTSKMEHFVIIINGSQPLTIITKSSILDVAAVLDPTLTCNFLLNF